MQRVNALRSSTNGRTRPDMAASQIYRYRPCVAACDANDTGIEEWRANVYRGNEITTTIRRTAECGLRSCRKILQTNPAPITNALFFMLVFRGTRFASIG